MSHAHHQSETHLAPITHEAIAHAAYDIYKASGDLKGHCDENWSKAEKMLQNRGASPANNPKESSPRGGMAR